MRLAVKVTGFTGDVNYFVSFFYQTGRISTLPSK